MGGLDPEEIWPGVVWGPPWIGFEVFLAEDVCGLKSSLQTPL